MVTIDEMAASWRRRQAERKARDERALAIRQRLPAARRRQPLAVTDQR